MHVRTNKHLLECHIRHVVGHNCQVITWAWLIRGILTHPNTLHICAMYFSKIITISNFILHSNSSSAACNYQMNALTPELIFHWWNFSSHEINKVWSQKNTAPLQTVTHFVHYSESHGILCVVVVLMDSNPCRDKDVWQKLSNVHVCLGYGDLPRYIASKIWLLFIK
jgi:hypothetical protein